MTDLSTSTAVELRAIVANTADADLRTAARIALIGRPVEKRTPDLGQDSLLPARGDDGGHELPRPMTRAGIREARRHSVVLLDGRRPFDQEAS